MKARAFDLRHFDVAAFAGAAATRCGELPIEGFERIRDVLAGAVAGRVVHWSVVGRTGSMHGGERQLWLHLVAQASVPLTCQRCLEPCETPVRVDREFQFVRDEAQAARLDAEVEHEVLALDGDFDLHRLLEDELLLELPLVPRHEICPASLMPPASVDEGGSDEHPFAALAVLRRRDQT